MASRGSRAVPLRRAPPRRAKDPKPVIRPSFPNSRRSRRLGQLTAPRPNYILSDDEGEDGDESEDDAEDDDSSDSGEDEDGDVEADSRHANGEDSFAGSSSRFPVRRSKRKRAPAESPATPPPKRRRTPRSARSARSASNNFNAAGATTPSRTRLVSRITPRRKHNNAVLLEEDPNAVIPPWETLPYLILVQIMLHASSPLDTIGSVRWLLAAGRTCRAFAEPAITALYRSPPLLKTPMVHNLIALLDRPAESLMFNYRQKIEFITIDVGVLDSHSYQGRHVDFKALVSRCPRLSMVDICHYKDGSPYRHLDDNIKWTYPAGLFEGLQGTSPDAGSDASGIIRLKNWRWSSRMMGSMQLVDIKTLHQSPSFEGLRKVAFVNFQRPALLAKDPDDPQTVAQDAQYAIQFAEMLAALPNLRHLVLESSTAANENLLPLLPKTIEHLELINCWDVTADHLSAYLRSHGSGITSLTLDHCQSLSLAFLPALRESCPRLRALRMNLTYFSQHEFYNDSDPMYEKLLEPHQIPTWPSSLQVLELEHLRHWEVQAAENLFQSLLDNSSRLPALRRLVVKAMLDIPWRQRSQFRDKYVAAFTRVFRRRFEDPQPHRTLRKPEPKKAPASMPRRERTPSRRSTRIATNLSGQSDNQMEEHGSVTDSEGDSPSPTSATGLAIQGLCEVVDVRFDNQKPTETQYNMDDFLDSDDANDDDDWTGDDGDAPGYAW